MKATLRDSINPKVLIASCVGNMLEFYDFTLYGFFVAIISPLFFPAADPFVSLVSGFGVFAVGFLTRPLGGIIFGHIGDKHGRKKALSLSVALMSIPTLTIAVLPTYEQIGVAAPIILLLARLLQGLCAGGEYNGAGVFIAEHTHQKWKGFTGSIMTSSGLLGALLATLSGAFFTQEGFPDWAWRIPFASGLFLALIGFYIRRKTIESPAFKEREGVIKKQTTAPIWKVLTKHPLSVLSCALIGSNTTIAFYLILIYINSNLLTEKILSAPSMMMLNATILALMIFLLPVAGRLSDIVGHRRLMTISAMTAFCAAIPITMIFETRNLYYIIPMQAIIILVLEGYNAPFNPYMARLFPVEYRYTGVAFGYSLGLSLFGGPAPYVVGWLIKTTQNPYMLSLCIMGGNLLGLTGLWLSRRVQKDLRAQTALKN